MQPSAGSPLAALTLRCRQTAARRHRAALHYVEQSMHSVLSFSFLIIKEMKADLRAGEIGGTLPIL
jgi:hypothetical protein